MELRAYWAVLVKRGVLVASIVVLSLAAAAASILLVKPAYRGEAQMFVSTQISAGNLNQELFQGSNFSTDRVKSYTKLAHSPTVLNPVIAELALPVTAAQLALDVRAEVPLETVLIDISATSDSPDLAAALANAVSASLAKVIEDLEKSDTRGSSPVKATVVTNAIVPTSPEWPSIPVNLGLGLLAGLVLGVGVALALETFNTSVKDPKDLLGLTVAPVLATVARDTGRNIHPIVGDDPLGPRGEAYRQLRTNLRFASVEHSPRVIVVTSALASEGKSTVAGNLALTMAQVGTRVCLVDGDLRHPSLAEYFGLRTKVGLSTVLSGQASIEQALQPVSESCSVITSGAIPPNPAELLSSQNYAALLEALSERFDQVVVDAPPTLPAADAAILAASSDGVIFVVHADHTTRHQIERALHALEQVRVRVLGVVLNMVPSRGLGKNRYWYGSSYGQRPSATPAPPLAEAKQFVAVGVVGRNGGHRAVGEVTLAPPSNAGDEPPSTNGH